MKPQRVSLALALAFLVILSGCSSSQVITNLQIALDAITAGLPILGSVAGVPPSVVSAVTTYAAQTNAALGQASAILSGPGTDAEKAALIAAAFAGIVKPDVPAQYAAIVALVSTIAGDVAQFLSSVPATSAAARTATAPHTTAWSAGDKEKLAKAQRTAATNGVSLAALRGK